MSICPGIVVAFADYPEKSYYTVFEAAEIRNIMESSFMELAFSHGTYTKDGGMKKARELNAETDLEIFFVNCTNNKGKTSV